MPRMATQGPLEAFSGNDGSKGPRRVQEEIFHDEEADQ